MPLHTIPLCTAKYVGDTHSSATFEYDTIGKILKPTERLLCKDKVVGIDKVNNKYVYNRIKAIEKSRVDRSMYAEIKHAVKNRNKPLDKDIGGIIVLDSREFKTENKEITTMNIKSLKIKDKQINIVDIRNLDTGSREMHKAKDKVIFNQNILELNRKSAKELSKIDLRRINISSNKELASIESLEINKNNVINLRNKLKKIYKSNNIILKNLNLLHLNKNNNFKFTIRETIKDIDDNSNKFYFYTNQEKYIDRYIYKYIDTFNSKQLDKNNMTYLLYRSKFSYLYKLNSKGLDGINYIDIALSIANKLMYKDSIKKIYKNGTEHYTYKMNSKEMFKYNQRYFYRKHLKSMYRYDNKYLDRKGITFMHKGYESYLDYISLAYIYKQIEKDLLDLAILDIYKQHDKQLQGMLIKDIYKVGNNNKFIEVTKRWWWLRPTAPTDKLIIPNKDYVKMKELLENPNFEYLRYNEHPIEWGKDRGIDYNIPPYAVSVEIMLDLINILTMVWHKNVQGWLSITGKEAIQLLMELIYDWYTLDTSSPNIDYLRAYRWIRWEAEKVYFLNTENGLQAIGIFIANLIDYMKYHHFDLVPLWRNPKSMDIERQFNRVATNGDLMKDLNKLKGNRHYYIETQNLERKDVFRR
ncbi:hypothetical protein [Clostridium algidicarnis]|uniref:hypothetical protein n=1 Tax=Clostridium algidicarnis TaxID=37659 RepID=UPI001C0BE04C|nr:hypothetical protein [Clostridium algidicarnis]MBU3205118.1 hypothetical protein [Clostridium algidicarnis]MBU3213271.1 hypothetical protein [Clostridium algidicarnis]MBU3223834.1 hypothetical protein [Clostridium algidicarnis]